MKDNNHLISIIVPCYNQQEYINECLESVFNQSYQNWECIIIDDGSTDNSKINIELFTKKDNRFKYFFQENKGLSAARNSGLKIANGKFILPLDGDDKIDKYYLEKAIEYFNINPNTKLIYSNACLFGSINKDWELGNYNYDSILLANCIFCSAIFHREDALKIGGYDENMKIGYEDWEFWIRLLNKDSIVHKLSGKHFFYRQRENSRNSFALDKQKLISVNNYIAQKNSEKYLKLFNSDSQIDLYKNLKQEIEDKNNQINQLKNKIKKTISYKTIYKIEVIIRNLLKK